MQTRAKYAWVGGNKENNGIKVHTGGTSSNRRTFSEIMTCGEYAARKMQYGPNFNLNKSDEVIIDNMIYSWLKNNEFTPVDPKRGYPSLAHLDAMTSNNAFGFIPKKDIQTLKMR